MKLNTQQIDHFLQKSVLIRVNPCQISAKSADIFMQNEPNFKKSEINASPSMTNDYVKIRPLAQPKNKAKTKPNQSQFKPNFDTAGTKTNPIKPNLWPTPFETNLVKMGNPEPPSGRDKLRNLPLFQSSFYGGNKRGNLGEDFGFVRKVFFDNLDEAGTDNDSVSTGRSDCCCMFGRAYAETDAYWDGGELF